MAGSAIPFFRELGTIVPFSANALQSREVYRGMVYREMYLRIKGQLEVAADANIPANMFPGDEWAVAGDITLRINGRDVFKRIDGPALRWLQYYQFGEFPRKALGNLGDGITLNPEFDSTLIVPFWMPRSHNPMDFAFDSSKVSRIDLEVYWNNYLNINSAATGFITPPKIEVSMYEVANVGGAFARWNIFPIDDFVAGAQTRRRVKIPVGYMYRSFLIHDVGNPDTGVPIIDHMYLVSHPTEWLSLSIKTVRDVIGIDRRNSIVPGAFTNTYYLAGAPGDDIFHFIYMDFVGHGNNTESIDAFGLSDLFMEFDTNNAGLIKLTPSQLVVPRG